MTSIIIPSCRSRIELSPMVCDIEGYIYDKPFDLICTCLNASAARNRNAGLNASPMSAYPLVIMCDDDIAGFHDGWAEGMVEPLLADPDVVMVSARLYRPDGELAYNMGENFDVSKPIVESVNRKLATACVAFRNDGTRFYEGFAGSGHEDTWFCECLNKKYPNGKYVTNNNVRLIHINEQKNQDINWQFNSALFMALQKGEIQ